TWHRSNSCASKRAVEMDLLQPIVTGGLLPRLLVECRLSEHGAHESRYPDLHIRLAVHPDGMIRPYAFFRAFFNLPAKPAAENKQRRRTPNWTPRLLGLFRLVGLASRPNPIFCREVCGGHARN